jgi:hypothetical protein
MDLLFPISNEAEFQKWLLLVLHSEREKLCKLTKKCHVDGGVAGNGKERHSSTSWSGNCVVLSPLSPLCRFVRFEEVPSASSMRV